MIALIVGANASFFCLRTVSRRNNAAANPADCISGPPSTPLMDKNLGSSAMFFVPSSHFRPMLIIICSCMSGHVLIHLNMADIVSPFLLIRGVQTISPQPKISSLRTAEAQLLSDHHSVSLLEHLLRTKGLPSPSSSVHSQSRASYDRA